MKEGHGDELEGVGGLVGRKPEGEATKEAFTALILTNFGLNYYEFKTVKKV